MTLTPTRAALTDREVTLLRLSATSGGMYAGDRWDLAPKVYGKLERMGLVYLSAPHNPAHKDRAVATEAGRHFLREKGFLK